MENLSMELAELHAENQKLKKENDLLKQHLREHSITIPDMKTEQTGQNGINEEKLQIGIHIFRSLFKGQDDVFAYGWKRGSGKMGYSPAISDGGKQQYLPLTNQVIYDHLMGERTVGLYPLLKDDTCYLLAVDFDKKDWQNDTRDFLQTCRFLHIPAHVERSRSGNGAHVWIFFQEALPAVLARNLGKMLLAKTAKRFGRQHLVSFDRLFPNQDVMPVGKFGNLIALPLQGKSRQNGNSVFVDDHFQPYKDQWLYLSSIEKMSRQDVEKLAAAYHHVEPGGTVLRETVAKPEILPEKIVAYLKNGIFIQKQGLSRLVINEIAQVATFGNPDFYKTERKRQSTKHIPRFIDCSAEYNKYIMIPRGCKEELEKWAQAKSIALEINDKTNLGKKIQVRFVGELFVQQADALDMLMKHANGILVAATGFGKTVVAAAMIAKRQVNTLIIVDRKQLMYQWQQSLSAFLDIAKENIGILGDGKRELTGNVDIATIQTLRKNAVLNNYGQVIVDECHHMASFTYEKLLRKADAAFVYGLTATPKRKDSLDKIIKMQLGPIRYKVSAKEQAKIRPFKHLFVPRVTAFKAAEKDIQGYYHAIMVNEARNDMIFNDVLNELDQGAKPVILTERLEHVRKLEKKLGKFVKNLIILTGELSDKQKQEQLKKLAALPDDEERLVIATGKYIGEGFDNPRLDTMFLTMPVSWKGTLEQYVGRLHRLHPEKTTVKVYDYVDAKVEKLQNMYENRKKGYESQGYVVAGSKAETQQMQLF